jgi:hypothetical protein
MVESEAGRGFYKIVTYEVPQEHWQELLEMCRVNAAALLKNPGVTSFESAYFGRSRKYRDCR